MQTVNPREATPTRTKFKYHGVDYQLTAWQFTVREEMASPATRVQD